MLSLSLDQLDELNQQKSASKAQDLAQLLQSQLAPILSPEQQKNFMQDYTNLQQLAHSYHINKPDNLLYFLLLTLPLGTQFQQQPKQLWLSELLNSNLSEDKLIAAIKSISALKGES